LGASRTQSNGINFDPQGATGVGRNIVVSGNTVRNHVNSGISISQVSGAATINKLSVSGNICVDNSANGIILTAATQAQFTDLSVVGNICLGNTTIDLRVSVDDAVIGENTYSTGTQIVQTLANSATPSVKGRGVFVTGGTTTITNFTNGVVGQEIVILSEHAITITDGTNIFLSGSANFVMASTDSLRLVQKANGKWYEVSRSVN
jgi:hypothetical protein